MLSLTLGQKDALSYILQGKSVFITGGGGTGKTVLLKYIIKHYQHVSCDII